MRFILCSDIHGNITNFEQMLRDMVGEDIDGIIICGDLEVSTKEVYDLIKDVFEDDISYNNIHIVRGNCDGRGFTNLPMVATFAVCGHKIYLSHGNVQGIPRRNGMYIAASNEGCDIAIFGHSHVPEDQMEDEIRFINPGSLNRNRTSRRNATYAVMDISEDEVDVEFMEIVTNW